MGICCLKQRKRSIEDDDYTAKKKHKNRSKDHQIGIINSSLASNFANRKLTDSTHGVQHSNPYLSSYLHTDKTCQFFTYFPFSEQVQMTIIKCIRNKENNCKFNYKKNTERKFLDQSNTIQQNQPYQTIPEKQLNYLINQGKKYIQQIILLKQSKFYASLRSLQLLKTDKQLSSEIIFSLISKIIHDKSLENQTNLLHSIQSDVISILQYKLGQNMKLPLKVPCIKTSLLTQNSNPQQFNPQSFQKDLQLNGQNLKLIENFKKNSSKQFYLLKIEITIFQQIFKSEFKAQKIQKIGISFYEPQNEKTFKNIKESQEIHFIEVSKIQQSLSRRMNGLSYQGNSCSLKLFISSSTIVRFKTYPLESTVTLHAPEFLKFIYVNQNFKFIAPLLTLKKQKVLMNQKINLPKSTQIASMGLRMQIFSSNCVDAVQKMRLQAKNTTHQLQMIKKGQNSWEHMNSLKSSFASISENQSSFFSYTQQPCC